MDDLVETINYITMNNLVCIMNCGEAYVPIYFENDDGKPDFRGKIEYSEQVVFDNIIKSNISERMYLVQPRLFILFDASDELIKDIESRNIFNIEVDMQ
jgi:hypothetical protein